MLSRRLHSPHAQNFVDVRDALSVLGSSEQLRNAAQKQFRSVILVDGRFDENKWNGSSYDLDGSTSGLICKVPELSATLVSALGNNLEQLTAEISRIEFIGAVPFQDCVQVQLLSRSIDTPYVSRQHCWPGEKNLLQKEEKFVRRLASRCNQAARCVRRRQNIFFKKAGR